MKSSLRSWFCVGLFLVACVVAGRPVHGQASGEGTAGLVDPVDRTALERGDAETPYRIVLPDGAACPGDSANDDWRVNSFIVPASEDLSELRFRAIGPQGPNTDSRWALYTDAPNPYSQRLTLANGEPGQPGRLDILPVMTFSLYPPETLPPGRYKMGIACSPGVEQTTATFWSTEIEISHDTTVDPPRIEWAVVDPATGPVAGSQSTSSTGIWIAAGLLALSAGVFVSLRRRSSRASVYTPRR